MAKIDTANNNTLKSVFNAYVPIIVNSITNDIYNITTTEFTINTLSTASYTRMFIFNIVLHDGKVLNANPITSGNKGSLRITGSTKTETCNIMDSIDYSFNDDGNANSSSTSKESRRTDRLDRENDSYDYFTEQTYTIKIISYNCKYTHDYIQP